MEYLGLQQYTPPLSNKKASNKKLDSQISYFSRIIKGLITESNEISLLKDKKSRLSWEKSSFLLDRWGCIIITIIILLGSLNFLEKSLKLRVSFWFLISLDKGFLLETSISN